MARVDLPLLSGKATGSLGENLVFRNRHGKTVVSKKRSGKGKGEVGKKRGVICGHFQRLTQLFKGLTREEWESWESYRISESKKNGRGRSAANYFISVNLLRLHRGLEAGRVAPTKGMKGNVRDVEASWRKNKDVIDVSWVLPEGAIEGDAVDVWVAGPFESVGRKPMDQDYRHYGYADGDASDMGIRDLERGGHYYVKVRFVMEDGRAGVFVRAVVEG